MILSAGRARGCVVLMQLQWVVSCSFLPKRSLAGEVERCQTRADDIKSDVCGGLERARHETGRFICISVSRRASLNALMCVCAGGVHPSAAEQRLGAALL